MIFFVLKCDVTLKVAVSLPFILTVLSSQVRYLDISEALGFPVIFSSL